VSPDLAEISFSVVTQGKNPETLSATNTDKMNAVLEFIKSQGIADADAKTTDYNLSPNYQWDKYSQRNFIVGYTLTQTVRVKVRDLSKVASVLAGLTPLGVNQVGNINFTFADPEKYLGMARADAFLKVQAKALAMVQSAGVSLGRVITIAENGYAPPPRPFYFGAAKAMDSMASMPPAPNIQPGTQDITDTVTITYEVR
jgi:uncharacterized protein YggE